MKNYILLLSILMFTSCTKDECKPLRCKITQYDYTICWLPDNKHQYVVFNEPEIWYLNTDKCELETEIKPMLANTDTIGYFRFSQSIIDTLNTRPTTCECY
jgi:hypothetical protein